MSHPPATAPVADLSQADYEALAAWRHTLRRFLHFSEEAAAAEGISPQQHQALLAIRGSAGGGAVTIGDLAAQLQIRHHSAVGLVDRLVAEKLAVREPCPQDRRKVLVRLAPRGQSALARLSSSHRQELRRLSPQLRTLLEQIGAA